MHNRTQTGSLRYHLETLPVHLYLFIGYIVSFFGVTVSITCTVQELEVRGVNLQLSIQKGLSVTIQETKSIKAMKVFAIKHA